jgi:protease-4
MAGVVSAIGSKDNVDVPKSSVLTIDLGQHFAERVKSNPMGIINAEETDIPGLYDVLRLIRHAKGDKNIRGIYIKADGNANGFAASEEIRNVILDFKKSKKFVLAYGENISQGAYYIASAADRIYANPAGGVDWSGYSMDLLFIKGTLEKLKIEPQIFYAGKFKSATEPLRTTQMTPENKLQSREWLGDLYNFFLVKTYESRKIDTATLHHLANTGAIQTPQDAVTHRLIDATKYDDEVKDEIRKKLGVEKRSKINFISINKYADGADFRQTGGDRIALIYAEGDIVDGAGTKDNIGSDKFVKLVRKARLDKAIKAIVFRVNSGGGSALASENIWRELTLAKAEKPVVVSFGDVAASGGYYIAVGADSIFASPNTITGSIGVFGIIPNMKEFFNQKLGITFDGVKTATYADAGSIYRPLNEIEKKFVQSSIDRIYIQFKNRVAQGRKMNVVDVDSIAQGRVWSGEDALRLKLVDKIGGLEMAVESAARMAKISKYRLREYPEKNKWLDELLGKASSTPEADIREHLGEEQFQIYQQMTRVKEMCNLPQARLPFQFFIR